MTEREKLIEALSAYLGDNFDLMGSSPAYDAANLLDLIDAHGAAIVPKEPTEEIMRAMQRCWSAETIYRGAIAASPYKAS